MKIRFTAGFAVVVFLFFLNPLFSHQAFCQEQQSSSHNPPNPDAPKPKYVEGMKAKPGTYQFVRTIKKGEVAFSTEILSLIESKRHDSQPVIIQVGEHTFVRILPRSVVNSNAFTPIESLVYEDEITPTH